MQYSSISQRMYINYYFQLEEGEDYIALTDAEMAGNEVGTVECDDHR